jgi:hypothetical protein
MAGTIDGSAALLHDLDRNDCRTICLFASVVAATMTLVDRIARAGLPGGTAASVEFLGLAFLLLNVAPLGGARWLWHKAPLWLGALALLVIFGHLPEPLAAVVGWGASLSGWLLLGWNAVRSKRRAASTAVLIAAALTLGLFTAGMHWGSGYANPAFEGALAGRQAHRDTLFHASIANMIRTYGVPSTGLDGHPLVRYHVGSHWVVASLASLTGTDVLEFYNRRFGPIFLPVEILTFLLFVLGVRSLARPAAPGSAISDNPWFWGVLLLIFVGPFTFPLESWLDLIFLSESYILGLAIAFTLLAVLLSFGHDWVNRRGSAAGDVVALLVVLPLLYVLCGATKISLMYLVLMVAAYAALRGRILWSPLVAAHFLLVGSLAVGLAIAMWTFQVGRPEGVESRIDMVARNWHRVWKPGVLFFFWPGVFLVTQAGRAFRKGQTAAAEAVIAVSVAGLLPAFFVPLGSDVTYFTHFQSLFAAALVLAFLGSVPRRWGGMVLVAGVTILVAINTAYAAAMMAKATSSARQSLVAPETAEARRLLDVLRQVAALPRLEKQTSVLFIPKSVTTYWDLETARAASAFVAPAITGVAMIGGLPDNMRPAEWDSYGFTFYYPPSAESIGGLDGHELVARANAMGFTQVLVIDEDAAGDFRLRSMTR